MTEEDLEENRLKGLDPTIRYILAQATSLTGGYGVPRGPMRTTCHPHRKNGEGQEGDGNIEGNHRRPREQIERKNPCKRLGKKL